MRFKTSQRAIEGEWRWGWCAAGLSMKENPGAEFYMYCKVKQDTTALPPLVQVMDDESMDGEKAFVWKYVEGFDVKLEWAGCGPLQMESWNGDPRHKIAGLLEHWLCSTVLLFWVGWRTLSFSIQLAVDKRQRGGTEWRAWCLGTAVCDLHSVEAKTMVS